MGRTCRNVEIQRLVVRPYQKRDKMLVSWQLMQATFLRCSSYVSPPDKSSILRLGEKQKFMSDLTESEARRVSWTHSSTCSGSLNRRSRKKPVSQNVLYVHTAWLTIRR
jgi:hypothetical protein